jgi:uncharacterized FlgJ-related protein
MNPLIFQILFLTVRAFHPNFLFIPVSQVLAQTMLETGRFTSKVCLENKNLFGMKMPGQRKTKALGTKNNHAYYNSYLDSVIDYFLWLDYFKLTTLEKYNNRIATNYATDTKYVSKIVAFEKQLKAQGVLINPSIFFTIIITCFFFIFKLNNHAIR